MIEKEVLKKIRRIQIRTSRAVTDVFAGQYKSVFKGKGMEFDEVREYVPGDDIRSIDWNVTARTGHPHIKKFVEEREQTVMLMVDLSRSMYFGTKALLKRQLAAELSSLLAFSAIRNSDRVGLILFSDVIECFVPPRKGLKHVLRIIRDILYHKPQGKGTDIAMALEHLTKVCKSKSVVFLISDFFNDDYQKAMAIANKRHDLVAISINDDYEKEFERGSLINFEDAETGHQILIDTASKKVRDEFKLRQKKYFMKREKMFRSVNIDHVLIHNKDTYVNDLVRFFRMREKRMR